MAGRILRGGCLRGGVAYEAEPPFLRFAHGHGSRCRGATGAAHASGVYVAPGFREYGPGWGEEGTS